MILFGIRHISLAFCVDDHLCHHLILYLLLYIYRSVVFEIQAGVRGFTRSSACTCRRFAHISISLLHVRITWWRESLVARTHVEIVARGGKTFVWP